MRVSKGAFTTPMLRQRGMRGGGSSAEGERDHADDKRLSHGRRKSDFSQLSLQAWQAAGGRLRNVEPGGHWLGYLSCPFLCWGGGGGRDAESLPAGGNQKILPPKHLAQKAKEGRWTNRGHSRTHSNKDICTSLNDLVSFLRLSCCQATLLQVFFPRRIWGCRLN